MSARAPLRLSAMILCTLAASTLDSSAAAFSSSSSSSQHVAAVPPVRANRRWPTTAAPFDIRGGRTTTTLHLAKAAQAVKRRGCTNGSTLHGSRRFVVGPPSENSRRTTTTTALADSNGGGGGGGESSSSGVVATLLSTLWEGDVFDVGAAWSSSSSSSPATTQENVSEATKDIGVYVKNNKRDLSQDGFGLLLPLAERIDDWTGGWGLSYADLRPHTEVSPAGIAFLATNVAYALAGMALTARGDLVFGTMTELAGAVSLWYHFSQLKYAGRDRAEVRLALLTDYIFAGAALLTGTAYMVQMGVTELPVECLAAGGAGIAALSLSWVWEFGFPYLCWHSLWHIFSAYTAYLVGQAHLSGGI